ncbi:hypothetical protein GALMADRAFT_141657 [Galerina marginata CBS 339.88]|uniref:Uncharacterized protein n=1 Tax=Galerina marginata (strain CBS 339.88) TaxID=685588 RepID=A0A067SV07_GALM3|nr:hypothetical protein GALMADRAFT_141657 [Galerina marginata CBS 339.88]
MPATTASHSVLWGLRGIQAARYARLASGSIMTFDHAMTLDREVDLIWAEKQVVVRQNPILNGKIEEFLPLSTVGSNSSLESLLRFGFRHVYVLPLRTPLRDRVLIPTFNSFIDSCLHFYQWQSWTGLIGSMLTEGGYYTFEPLTDSEKRRQQFCNYESMPYTPTTNGS